eukprot:SAG31_NODE_977_length_10615_cov_93.546786_10_plen_63_part_00
MFYKYYHKTKFKKQSSAYFFLKKKYYKFSRCGYGPYLNLARYVSYRTYRYYTYLYPELSDRP